MQQMIFIFSVVVKQSFSVDLVISSQCFFSVFYPCQRLQMLLRLADIYYTRIQKYLYDIMKTCTFHDMTKLNSQKALLSIDM
jgi:hypothetical protein